MVYGVSGATAWRDAYTMHCPRRAYLALSSDSVAVEQFFQYRWPDTEWKEEPAEPISDEYDLFCA